MNQIGCSKCQFRCGDLRTCIDSFRRCDGIQDCTDNLDEIKCPGKVGRDIIFRYYDLLQIYIKQKSAFDITVQFYVPH